MAEAQVIEILGQPKRKTIAKDGERLYWGRSGYDGYYEVCLNHNSRVVTAGYSCVFK